MTVDCTWLGCNERRARDMVAQDGYVWAQLCDAHASEMENAESSGDVRNLMRCWVRAQGGAKKAARRVLP